MLPLRDRHAIYDDRPAVSGDAADSSGVSFDTARRREARQKRDSAEILGQKGGGMSTAVAARMRKTAFLAPLLLALVTGACDKTKLNAADDSSAVEEVTICQFSKVFLYLPLYIAVEKRFFENEGVKVRLINGGGDEKTFATVASGQAQFGVADPTFAAIAREKGQPGTVVASIVSGAPFWGVTKKASVPNITEPSQLRGLRIATYTSPSTNYTLMQKTLREQAHDAPQARIVQGAFGTLLPMLDADAADVAMELEPTVSTALAQGARIVYSYPQAYGAFLLTGLYTTEGYRDAHAKTIQKVVNGLSRALQFAHTDRAGTIDVARKVFPELGSNVVESAVNRMLDEKTIPQDARIDPAAWNNAVRVRVEAGDLHSATAAVKTVDNSFAERALQR